jgi:hypothetical protein
VGACAWRVTVAAVLAAACARTLIALAPPSAWPALVAGGGGGIIAFALGLFWLSRRDAYLALKFAFPRLGHLVAGRD